MDLAKFVWLLQKRALFFARADKLGDPYEGYYTRATLQAEDQWVAWSRSRQQEGEAPINEEEIRSSFRFMATKGTELRTTLFVNSWHANEEESAAMWRLYTSLNESVCITSTFERLFEALPQQAHMGLVQYIDYEPDVIRLGNMLNNIMHKRRSYAHEREVRAVMWTLNEQTSAAFRQANEGLIVPIELRDVLDSVYVSPLSSPILKEVVTGLLEHYSLNVPVRQSEVNAPPAY